MTEKRFKSEELETHRQALCDFLKKQIRLIDFAIALLLEGETKSGTPASNDTEVINTIILMMQGVGVSAHSILKLSEKIDMQLRDALIISRSIVETAINVSYIIAGGTPVAKRAQRHAMQKSYRDLDRQSTFGPNMIKLQVQPAPTATPPELQEALKEFTNSRGKEVREWTEDNIERDLN